jgi:CDP-diacylglycerol--glycerol-3-phosphate 3-phosphatidyltransferase
VELLYYARSGNEWHRWAALLCFALASVLDGVDGFIARHFQQKSELGAILDPLADKLLLVSSVVVLSGNHSGRLGQIPLWLTGVILGRDMLIVTGIGVVRFTVGAVRIRARWAGKAATVLQMTVVIWILLKWDAGRGAPWLAVWMPAAAACTGLSGLWYVWDGVRQLSAHPASSAANP